MSRFDFVPASDGGDASGIVKSRPGGGRQRVGPSYRARFLTFLYPNAGCAKSSRSSVCG